MIAAPHHVHQPQLSYTSLRMRLHCFLYYCCCCCSCGWLASCCTHVQHSHMAVHDCEDTFVDIPDQDRCLQCSLTRPATDSSSSSGSSSTAGPAAVRLVAEPSLHAGQLFMHPKTGTASAGGPQCCCCPHRRRYCVLSCTFDKCRHALAFQQHVHHSYGASLFPAQPLSAAQCALAITLC
jgi:hypothetical protein